MVKHSTVSKSQTKVSSELYNICIPFKVNMNNVNFKRKSNFKLNLRSMGQGQGQPSCPKGQRYFVSVVKVPSGGHVLSITMPTLAVGLKSFNLNPFCYVCAVCSFNFSSLASQLPGQFVLYYLGLIEGGFSVSVDGAFFIS